MLRTLLAGDPHLLSPFFFITELAPCPQEATSGFPIQASGWAGCPPYAHITLLGTFQAVSVSFPFSPVRPEGLALSRHSVSVVRRAPPFMKETTWAIFCRRDRKATQKAEAGKPLWGTIQSGWPLSHLRDKAFCRKNPFPLLLPTNDLPGPSLQLLVHRKAP